MADAHAATARRQRRAAGLGPLVFLAYGAAEVAIGSWAFVLLTSRGMGTAAAGASVTAYWGALAAGRLGIGAAGTRISPPQVLAVSMVGAVVGGFGLWVLSGLGATVALVVLGLSLAGMFPALMALTPARVGPTRTHRVIANQLAASVIGGAAWSAAVGRGGPARRGLGHRAGAGGGLRVPGPHRRVAHRVSDLIRGRTRLCSAAGGEPDGGPSIASRRSCT